MSFLTQLKVTGMSCALIAASSLFTAQAHDHGDALQAAIDNPTRSAQNRARDAYRNPYDTLNFFGLEPNMTVVEIWPGGGWYTEILAPYLAADGKLYAAHFPANTDRQYYQRSRTAFVERVATDASFQQIEVTEFSPSADAAIAPAGSADMVLTFRNLHNWYMQGDKDNLTNAFKAFYTALKPGGIVGVVDHRLPESRADEDAKTSGYMKVSWAIAAAEAAGFEYVGASEVNANPNDNADHPRGVWTLPPSLALGEENKEKYQAIGESDRFTLKFRKPQS